MEKSVFSNTESYLPTWQAACPAVDIPLELAKAAAWLKTNPKNRKKNYARFLNGWLTKAQDRAPRAQAAAQAVEPVHHCMDPEQEAALRAVLEANGL